MAGSSDVNKQVNTWLLDYVVNISWHEFERTGSIDENSVDLIQCVFRLPITNEESSMTKKYFLAVLCRISDGEHFQNRYNEESEVTVLEDMLSTFDKLITEQPLNIFNAGYKIINNVKKEAVLVCCRAKDFEEAEKVCKRLLTKEDRRDRNVADMSSMLMTLIKNEVSDGLTSYADFVKMFTQYMKSIFDRFNAPLLLKASEIFMKESKTVSSLTHSSEGDGSHRKRRFRYDTINKARQKGCQTDEQSHPSEPKQRKLLNNTLKKMFGEDDDVTDTGQEMEVNTGNNCQGHQPSVSRSKSRSPVKCQSPKKPTSHDASKSPVYRKNRGRPDRHNPVEHAEVDRTKDGADENDDNISMISGESLMSRSTSLRKMWTEAEMKEFHYAVRTLGVGKWAEIRDYTMSSRTSVMLKDKWRNMVKSGDCDRLDKDMKKK